jgi:hypothetical protein
VISLNCTKIDYTRRICRDNCSWEISSAKWAKKDRFKLMTWNNNSEGTRQPLKDSGSNGSTSYSNSKQRPIKLKKTGMMTRRNSNKKRSALVIRFHSLDNVSGKKKINFLIREMPRCLNNFSKWMKIVKILPHTKAV